MCLKWAKRIGAGSVSPFFSAILFRENLMRNAKAAPQGLCSAQSLRGSFRVPHQILTEKNGRKEWGHRASPDSFRPLQTHNRIGGSTMSLSVMEIPAAVVRSEERRVG